MADTLDRLNRSYKAKTCRPALLACGKYSPDLMPVIAKICESITVRYSIVGEKNPNQLEKIYEKISSILRESNEPLFEIQKMDGFKDIPSDEEFIAKIFKMEIPSPVNSAWRQILVQLNAMNSSGETKVENPRKVHVEHVLPQNPKAKTLVETALTQEEAASLTHRIGNLTLLSSKLNQSISNKPFSEKRQTLLLSEIMMTKTLANIANWGEDEIENRSQSLAEDSAKVFKHPSDIVGRINGDGA